MKFVRFEHVNHGPQLGMLTDRGIAPIERSTRSTPDKVSIADDLLAIIQTGARIKPGDQIQARIDGIGTLPAVRHASVL